MTHLNKILIRIIASIILVSALLLLAGCNQRNTGPVTTTQYESYLEDEDATEKVWNDTDDWEEDDTTTSTTGKKTEAVKKDWKQAYTDYIYELEDSYSGHIRYYPCEDFTGDDIGDFICSLRNNDYELDKEIAVSYYNGDVVTFTSDSGFIGYDSDKKLIGKSAGDDGYASAEIASVMYYKFSDGKFVYDKTDVDENLADYTTGISYLKYEMLNAIKNGNSHGFF